MFSAREQSRSLSLKLYHRQASGALNTSQQGPSADIDSVGSENGDAERSSSSGYGAG